MAKPTANTPINYREQLAEEAARMASRLAKPSGDRIGYLPGNRGFRTPDGSEGDEIQGVVIEFMSNNLFYDSAYDRDNVQPPACFAIGPEPTMLIPSMNSPDRQADSCAVCPNNQFGSASNGKGKACKNTRLIAIIPSGDFKESPMWILSVPPASLKSFDGYVQSLGTKHKTIPIGVLTSITPDPNSQWASPRFSVVRPLEDDEIGLVMERREEALSRLTAEPDISGYKPPQGRARRPGR